MSTRDVVMWLIGTVGFTALLLVALYVPQYLLGIQPATPWWVMPAPSLVFGLCVTAVLMSPPRSSGE